MEERTLATLEDDATAAIHAAREAREQAYAPYSNYLVGAVIVTRDGSRYRGHNIENVNYTNSAHGEQVALHAAVRDGHRSSDMFYLLALSSKPRGSDTPQGDPPCGLCLQSLSEFCPPDFRLLVDAGDVVHEYTLKELLPEGMTGEALLGDDR